MERLKLIVGVFILFIFTLSFLYRRYTRGLRLAFTPSSITDCAFESDSSAFRPIACDKQYSPELIFALADRKNKYDELSPIDEKIVDTENEKNVVLSNYKPTKTVYGLGDFSESAVYHEFNYQGNKHAVGILYLNEDFDYANSVSSPAPSFIESIFDKIFLRGRYSQDRIKTLSRRMAQKLRFFKDAANMFIITKTSWLNIPDSTIRKSSGLKSSLVFSDADKVLVAYKK